jgi:D-mannonate dehydratase
LQQKSLLRVYLEPKSRILLKIWKYFKGDGIIDATEKKNILFLREIIPVAHAGVLMAIHPDDPYPILGLPTSKVRGSWFDTIIKVLTFAI